jgi:hypothetical protein
LHTLQKVRSKIIDTNQLIQLYDNAKAERDALEKRVEELLDEQVTLVLFTYATHCGGKALAEPQSSAAQVRVHQAAAARV